MAFPVSPTEGQTFTENNTVWIYSSTAQQWFRSQVNPENETFYEFGGSATATGNAGEIQYTDGTNLAASPNLVWDDVNDELEVGGDVVLDDGGTFTTTLQTVTPTQNRTISFPDATGTVGLVAGSSGQLVYNNAGANAGVPSSVIGATGDVTLALNGAASTPPLDVTGTWFTGGTSTTTKPQVLIEPAGATSTAWSTSGTGLGVNAASGFAGRLLDLQLNGTSRAVVTGAGRLGIGIASPNSPLDVSASGNNGAAFNDGIRSYSADRTQYVNVGYNGINATNNLGLFVADTERLRCDSIGSIRVVTALTVATLPGTPAVGMIARVTDATAPAVGSTVTGGGAAAALVWYNGANWSVIGV